MSQRRASSSSIPRATAGRSSVSLGSNSASRKRETDPHTAHILKKFGLDDIMPKAQDFDTARASLLPLDGSDVIFAGGKPIARRRESSSPAVTEALARGFKLAHFPARALLPEDMFSDHNNLRKQIEQEEMAKLQQKSSVSPDPRKLSPSVENHNNNNNSQSTTSRNNNNNNNNPARIPGNIDPHVLPQGALMKPLPSAKELYNTDIPLQETSKFDVTNQQWLYGVDNGDWMLSDPVQLTNMARVFRRCFPRTEKDDQYEEFPTSNYSGNFILKRYGGCFPEHCHYSFYKKYGEFGMGAATSEYHNFPAGRHPLAPI